MTRFLGLMVLAGLLQLPVQAAGPVIKFPLPDTRPYGWIDAQGQAQGLLPDIVAALAIQAQLAVKIEIVPYARAVQMLEAGTGDASLLFSTGQAPSNRSHQQPEQAMAVFLNRQVVQLRPGLNISSRADLAGLVIGRKRGGCQELIDDKSQHWKFSDYASHEAGLKMLLMGRIDGLCTADEALLDVLDSTGMRAVFESAKAQRFTLAVRPVWLMLTGNFPAPIRERLIAGMRQLQKDGSIVRIFKARLGDTYILDLPK